MLFCPFCREPFEDATRCPAHDLPLVPFLELPRPHVEHPPDVALPWFAPSHGRWQVATAAALSLIAFVAFPFMTVSSSVELGGTMLELAREGTPRLWMVPAVAIAQLSLVLRRRSPEAMRGARVAVPLLSLFAAAVVGSCIGSTHDAVALLGERTGEALQPRLGAGAYCVLAAAAFGLLHGARFGDARPFWRRRR